MHLLQAPFGTAVAIEHCLDVPFWSGVTAGAVGAAVVARAAAATAVTGSAAVTAGAASARRCALRCTFCTRATMPLDRNSTATIAPNSPQIAASQVVKMQRDRALWRHRLPEALARLMSPLL